MNEINYARITGILFITATVAGLMSAVFLGSTLEKQDYLDIVASKEIEIYFVILFELIMALAVALIPISMYPILKKYNSELASGSVGFRIIEGAFFIIGASCLLLLLSVSKEFQLLGTNNSNFMILGDVKANFSSSIGDSYLQTLGEAYKSNLPWIIGGLFFTIGALMYYLAFYQSDIIPKWLSVFGILGVVLAFTSYFLQLLSFNLGDFEMLLRFPIFIQEMVLAVWLIIKGYNLKKKPSLLVAERFKHDKSYTV